MSVKIIVDSASDIRPQEANAKGITVIPLTVSMDGNEYLDGVTITHEEFYQRLASCAALPTTSQVTPHAFSEHFAHAVAGGHEAVVITISGKLSGTAQSAVIAAEKFGDRVRVVDSLNACVGERILIEYALRLRDSGMDAGQMATELEDAKQRIRLVATLDTLEYVVKGGRLSKTAGAAGTLLNIHPVVGLVDGELKVLGKAIGAKKTNNLLTQTIQQSGGVDFQMPVAVGYSGADDAKLRDYVENSRALWQAHTSQLPTFPIGSTIGTYAGPGAVAVAFFAQR